MASDVKPSYPWQKALAILVSAVCISFRQWRLVLLILVIAGLFIAAGFLTRQLVALSFFLGLLEVFLVIAVLPELLVYSWIIAVWFNAQSQPIRLKVEATQYLRCTLVIFISAMPLVLSVLLIWLWIGSVFFVSLYVLILPAVLGQFLLLRFAPHFRGVPLGEAWSATRPQHTVCLWLAWVLVLISPIAGIVFGYVGSEIAALLQNVLLLPEMTSGVVSAQIGKALVGILTVAVLQVVAQRAADNVKLHQ